MDSSARLSPRHHEPSTPLGATGARCSKRELLAPVYGWFTEGFDTRDLKEAKALLEEVAASRRRDLYGLYVGLHCALCAWSLLRWRRHIGMRG